MTPREIDVLIAEKIFHWKHLTADGGGNPIFFMPPSGYNSEYIKSLNLIEVPAGDENNAPSYSQSIALAMQVWDELRNSDRFCCLEIYSDYHYCWKVSLIEAGRLEDALHEPTYKIDGVEAGMEGLAMAICIVALRAYGVEL
jgi:hypothetical protein